MSINITSNLREFVELVELKCLSTSETLAPAWENTNTKGLARAQGIETSKSETFAEPKKPREGIRAAAAERIRTAAENY